MVALDTLDALFKEWSIGGICFRLLMATVAGVIIGMDREYKNKGAGVKTRACLYRSRYGNDIK